MTAPLTGDPNLASDLGYRDIIRTYLQQWGLSDLSTLVDSLGRTGASNDQISLQLQASPEYKTRFAGNEARLQQGLSVLSPAQYIALEGQYKQTMRDYGLPQGFYDDKASTDALIGGDVSAAELSSRVKLASDSYINADEGTKQAWNQYYGIHGVGGALAAIIDPQKAEPLLQQQATAAGIGGAAISQGLTAPGVADATRFAQGGVTLDSARKSYAQIAQTATQSNAIGGRFGLNLNQSTQENASLLGDAASQQRIDLGNEMENAAFSGKAGASKTANDPNNNY